MHPQSVILYYHSFDCGYQHAIYTLPDAIKAKDPLTVCKELVFTVRSMDDAEAASVNIGGLYIAKIVATGCGGTSAIHNEVRLASNKNAQAKLFDLNGNLLWQGAKSEALNDKGNIRLDVRQGMYLLKTTNGVQKAVKK